MNSTNKNCPECNTSNYASAKFCINCGHKFNESTKNISEKICNKCGEVNKQDSQFCAQCGNSIQRRNQVKRQKINVKKSVKTKSSNKNHTKKSFPIPILFIAGGIILFYLFIIDNQDENQIQDNFTIQNSSQNIELNSQVYEIASRFICSCGACGEEALETCTCATAVKERDFIKAELKKGKTIQQVIASVNSKYGHLKPEYADNVEKDLNLNISQKLQTIDVASFPNLSTGNIKLANFKDREDIYSHFECPCGQCGIPELLECNCSHPGGATEVKKYIDEIINEKNYTVAQIIEKVNEHYGHKIR